MGGIGNISVDQKLKGELGSEDSKDINQASVIRLVWRLCRSNTLRPTWMNTHNLKGNHLVQASATILDSGTWKWICSLKTLVLSNMAKNWAMEKLPLYSLTYGSLELKTS